MVREMRALGRAGWFGWALNQLLLPAAARPQGFVWEEAGKLVGNASLLGVSGFPERWVLANVAVRSAFRRRGIGRQLVAAAVEEARSKGASGLYLQVEPGNVGAVRLYEQQGFQTLTTRTSWRRPAGLPIPPPVRPVSLRPRQPGEWSLQWELAVGGYPEGLFWPYPLRADFFRSAAARGRRHWLAWDGDRAAGSLTVREGKTARLVILVSQEAEGQIEGELIRFGLASLRSPKKRVAVEYRAEVAREAFEELGFRAQRTLTWMRRRLGR
jgi:GNAT superfamily N-acetyltransferase